jgi:hypothetical protein
MPCLSAALLISFPVASAADGQVRGCPTGDHTLEMIQERIQEIHRADGPSDRIAALVGRALAIHPPPGCTLLLLSIDRQHAMERLITFAGEHIDPHVEALVLRGISEALADPGQAELEIPLPVLANRIEQAGSRSAASMLLRSADHTAVRDYLLSWARAEHGPPGRPNLPSELVQVLIQFPASSQEALRAEVISNLSLLRNARARCLVENRNRRDPPPCPDLQ